MPPRVVHKKHQKSSIEEILELAQKPGVTVLFDTDPSSQESKMGVYFNFQKSDKILRVIIPTFDGHKDRPRLLKFVKDTFENGGLILKVGNDKTLESYRAYAESHQDSDILEFFKTIIPPNDYNALKASLFIRSEMKKGNPVHLLKQDIRDKYGDRGANISNLCSANYFEDEFQPLYREVAYKEEFNTYYELAVGKKARALFVHINMTLEDIATEFDRMVAKGVRYHMPNFRVHGIGEKNVANIKEFFKNLQSDDLYEGLAIEKDLEKTRPPLIQFTVSFS